MPSITNPAARASSRKAGRAAARKMTAKQRSERARNAALARWNSHNALKHVDPRDPLFARLLKAYSDRPMD